MIGIDSVPPDYGDEKDADGGANESPEELLRRLEEEKQDWQRQLAMMKATLEAQDRAIEEDRSKCREFLDNEEVKVKEAQLVPANKAPTRTVRVVGGTSPPTASKLPVVNERTRTVWPSIADFHNRRARSVAKAMPMLSEAYLHQYGAAPTRYSTTPGFAAPSALSAHQSQDFSIDSLGRVVRSAKVLGYGPTASSAIVPSSPAVQGFSSNSSGLALSAGTPITVSTPQTSMISIRRPSTAETSAIAGGVPWIGTPGPQPRVSTVSAVSVPMTPTTTAVPATSSWAATFSNMFGSATSVPVAEASPAIQYRIS